MLPDGNADWGDLPCPPAGPCDARCTGAVTLLIQYARAEQNASHREAAPIADGSQTELAFPKIREAGDVAEFDEQSGCAGRADAVEGPPRSGPAAVPGGSLRPAAPGVRPCWAATTGEWMGRHTICQGARHHPGEPSAAGHDRLTVSGSAESVDAFSGPRFCWSLCLDELGVLDACKLVDAGPVAFLKMSGQFGRV